MGGWGFNWDSAKRLGGDVVFGGLPEVKKYFYDDPAAQQKAGYDAAGGGSAKLGTDQRNYETQQGNTALNYYSQTPGKAELTPGVKGWRGGNSFHAVADPNAPVSPDQALANMANNRPTQQQDYFNFMGDQAHKQTNQEELYSQRKNGNDPAAAYEDQRATEGINTQLAARGRYNSGSGVRQISDYLANANAQRSHDLGTLAGGADNSRVAMDTAYGGAAKGASAEQSDYYGNVMGASQKLADAKADTYGHYSDRGSDEYMQGQLANIEAQLAKSGVDAATRKEMLHDIGEGFKTAAKAKGGGG